MAYGKRTGNCIVERSWRKRPSGRGSKRSLTISEHFSALVTAPLLTRCGATRLNESASNRVSKDNNDRRCSILLYSRYLFLNRRFLRGLKSCSCLQNAIFGFFFHASFVFEKPRRNSCSLGVKFERMESNRSFYAGKARELSSRRRGKRTYLLFRKQMFRGNLPRDYIIFKLDYSPGRPSCIHKGIRYDPDLSRSRQPSQLQSLCERNLSQVGSWTSRLTIARLGRIHR